MKTISDHVFDIVENSVRANATVIEIIVIEDNCRDIYTLQIIDNGCGMDKETVRKASSPFFTSRTTRKIGMGLSLLKHNAQASKGTFALHSEPGRGTKVKALFQLSHLDRPPVGDIAEVLYLLLLSSPGIRFLYSHRTQWGIYDLDSTELLKVLDKISLQQAEIKEAVIGMIRNNLEEINASK